MDFLQKYDEKAFADLYWNIPEVKQGSVAIIGGNGQSFRTVVKTAEYLSSAWPVKNVRVVLPDILQGKLPPVPDVIFLPSTESGSFSETADLGGVAQSADFTVIVGDLSRNSITAKAVASACEITENPLLITRDAVDLVAGAGVERFLLNENLILMGSLAQVIKVFRGAYYPRMLTLSQPLTQVAEGLHKFTLSYPVKMITLAGETVLLAKSGEIAAVPLNATGYLPLTLWSGEAAAKIAAMNLFSPGNFIAASVAALYKK